MVRGPQIIRTDKSSQPGRRSLRLSLMLWFLGIALLPLIAVGTFGYSKAHTSRREEIQINLNAVAEIEQAGVEEFFDRAVRELNHQGGLAANQNFLTRMNDDLRRSELNPLPWSRSSGWHELTSQAGQELRKFRNSSPWQDILLLDPTGVVLFRCSPAEDLGSNILTGPAAQTNLAAAVVRATEQQQMVLSRFAAYTPGTKTPVAFLVVPVTGTDKANLGLMAFQISSEKLQWVTTERELLVGDTSVYLIDDQLRALTHPRGLGERSLPTDQVVTAATSQWLDQRSAPTVPEVPVAPLNYLGITGETVFGRCSTITVLGQRFGLVTEVNADQALAGLAEIRLAMGLMIALTVLMVVLVGQAISSRVVQPIVALGKIMKRVADGHDVDDMQVVGHNEVGDLADQFVTMLEHLTDAQHSRDHQYQLQQSQFELNEKMRGEPDTVTLAAAILESIGDFYGAQVGAFYLAKPGQRLVLAAQIGDAGDEWPVPELREGQGLVGRSAVRRRIEILRDIPVEHLQVQTAMGRSKPRTVIVAPFHIAGQVKGVMELGTVDDVSDEALEFLRMSAESVAVALDSSRSRERVHRLLDETRRQAGTLARQQKELQESNAQLAQSDRYKSEFLANMSHELRTPLNSMMLMSQVLSENRRGVLNSDEVEAATTINYAGEELLKIINDILDLSKVEAGKLELSPDNVDLSDLMSDLHHLFKPEAADKQLEFRSLAGPGVPKNLYTDGLRLKQILKNLLSNACKFTDEGSVVLRARMPSQTEMAGVLGYADDNWVALSVADTGIGMSDDIKDQVFEAFNQGDGSIGRKYGGSGLGLSISRRLAELLKGHLTVSSIEGKGTTFTLFLPLAANHFDGPVVNVLPESGASLEVQDSATLALVPDELKLLKDCHFVLADDEMRTVFQLGDELSQRGLDPQIVRSAQELLQLAATIPSPSVVLVNPDCEPLSGDEADGQPLLKKLGEAFGESDVRIIALASPATASDLTGADAVVRKPIAVNELLSVCHRVVTAERVVT